MAPARYVLPLVALASALLAAFFLREATADGYRLPESERRGGPEWVVDDPDAAYHLRRTQLTLTSGSVPRFDRYLNHPSGSPIPWPPFTDGMFALVARAFASGDSAKPEDQALGGYSESNVESVLMHVPPVVGALAALAVALCVFALTDSSGGRAGRLWAAALAAWVYAALPVSVWYGGVTRLDHHVVIALLLALHVAFVSWSLRAEQLVDGIFGALLAGLVAGLALTSWLASGVFVLCAGVAFFLRVLAANTERDDAPARTRDAVRAGILYFAAAAVTTSMPAAASAWNAVQPGSLLNLTEGVPRALVCAIVPFVVAGSLARPGRARIVPLAGALASLAATVVFLPGFLDGVREGLAWASRENLFMDVVGESRPLDGVNPLVSKLSLLVFVFPIAWLLCLPSAFTRPARAHLVLLGAVLTAMTLRQQRFGNSLAIPFACTLAVALHDRLRNARTPFGRRAWTAAMGACALALIPSVRNMFETTPAEYADLRDWRAEVVGGLRWMRAETPSPGPFNAPEHPQDYGVLSSWGFGHLIEYHARRPTVTTNFGSFVGADNFRDAAAALVETKPDDFARKLRELGADYVVVSPRMVAELSSTMRIAGADPASLFERTANGVKVLGQRARRSAVWRLALHDDARGSASYPGLELVYASQRHETPAGTRPRAGEPAGPVISIYRSTTTREAGASIGTSIGAGR